MRVVTRTNLDLEAGDHALLPELPGVPSVGHKVHIRWGLTLEVVGVTWFGDRVEVELHIPRSLGISINEWQVRYQVQRGKYLQKLV